MFLKKNRIFLVFLVVLSGKNLGAMDKLAGVVVPLANYGSSFAGQVVKNRLPVKAANMGIEWITNKYYNYTEASKSSHTSNNYNEKIINFNQQEVHQKYLAHPLVVQKQLETLYDEQGNFKLNDENKNKFESIAKYMFLGDSFLNIFGEVQDNENLKIEIGGWGWHKGSKKPSYDEISSKKQNFSKNHVDGYFNYQDQEKVLNGLKLIVEKEVGNAKNEFDDVKKNFDQKVTDELTADNLGVDLSDDDDNKKEKAFENNLNQFKEKIQHIFSLTKNTDSDQFGNLYRSLKNEIENFYRTENYQKKNFLIKVNSVRKTLLLNQNTLDEYKTSIINPINEIKFNEFDQTNIAENQNIKENVFNDYRQQLIEQLIGIFNSVDPENINWDALEDNLKDIFKNFMYDIDETKKAISESALGFIDDVFKGKMPTKDEVRVAIKNIVDLNVNVYFDEETQNLDSVEEEVFNFWKQNIENIRQKNKNSFRNKVDECINKIEAIEKINQYIVENSKIQPDNVAFIAFKNQFENTKKTFIGIVANDKNLTEDSVKTFFEKIQTVSIQYTKDKDDLNGGAQDIKTGIQNYEKSFENDERQPRIAENTKNFMDGKIVNYGTEFVMGSLFSNPLTVGFALGTRGATKWAHGKLKNNWTRYGNATTSVNNGTTYVYNKIKDNSSEDTAKKAASIGKQGLTSTFMITLGFLFTKLLQKAGFITENENFQFVNKKFQSVNKFLNVPREWFNKFLGLFVEKAVVPVANKVQDYTHIDSSRRK